MMKREVKLRLPNKASHEKLLLLLSQFYKTTQQQYNNFFDGTDSQLSSRQAVLLLRFYFDKQTDIPRCFFCLKAKTVITNGVSYVEGDDDDVDLSTGNDYLEDPGKLMDVDLKVLRRVKEEFGVNSFKRLGDFWTERSVYVREGLKLEVDEVKYKFGDLFEVEVEVECENNEPEKVKEDIMKFFKDNGIEYSESLMSKSAIFLAGKLPS